jgi:serine/threonine-protein kinase
VAPSIRVDSEIPPALDQLVLQCLEKDPKLRPARAQDLADRLRATGLAQMWTQDKARDWWEDNDPDEIAGTPPDDTNVT